MVHLIFVVTFCFQLIYHIGFNLYWHRIAYFVLMVPLRIYSLTHPVKETQNTDPNQCPDLITELQSETPHDTFATSALQSSTITVFRIYNMTLRLVDLPRSRWRFGATDGRLVPVLFEQVKHIEIVAAVVWQWVRSRVHASKHPHLIGVQCTAVVGQRWRTAVVGLQQNTTAADD